MRATPAAASGADVFDLGKLSSFATLAVGREETEHLVLSDGYRRIRLDVSEGTLRAGPVHLRYCLQGFVDVDTQILTLRRLLALNRLGRFARNLHPREHLAPRWLYAMRVHDATAVGASQREIAAVIYGQKSAMLGRDNGSDVDFHRDLPRDFHRELTRVEDMSRVMRDGQDAVDLSFLVLGLAALSLKRKLSLPVSMMWQ